MVMVLEILLLWKRTLFYAVSLPFAIIEGSIKLLLRAIFRDQIVEVFTLLVSVSTLLCG